MSRIRDDRETLRERFRAKRKSRQERMRFWVAFIAILIAVIMLLGIIIPAMMVISAAEPVGSVEANYDTVEVQLGSIQREVSKRPDVVWLDERELTFPYDGAYVDEVMVRQGRWVEEGEVLVRFTRLTPEAELARKALELQHLTVEYEERIAPLQEELEQANGAGVAEALTLRLELLEAEGERRTTALEEEIADLQASYEVTELLAPMSGLVTYVSMIRPGEYVNPHEHLLTLRNPELAYLVTEGHPEAFRYGEQVVVEHGLGNDPQYIDAEVIITPGLSELAADRAAIYLEIAPEDLQQAARVAEKDPATYTLDDLINPRITTYSTAVSETLVVPKQAVNQSAGKRYVYVLEDDVLRRRYIQVGVDDLENYQVLAGLELGQTLVIR